jgi:2-oxoglutarate ferredoxin oxidoreductase subunit beta
MVYIVENNGVYGLTKGQFSATADAGSTSKGGVGQRRRADRPRIDGDLLGATYVGRGFSGDKHQLVPLIKGAIEHRGIAFLDVISPCVAFNNHPGLDQELRLCARAQRGRERAGGHDPP